MNDDRVITLEDLSAGWPTAIQSPSMVNGQWSMVNGSIYDLQGRRLAKIPAKGLYIQNGKKQLAK
jgi:hypothetical protein